VGRTVKCILLGFARLIEEKMIMIMMRRMILMMMMMMMMMVTSKDKKTTMIVEKVRVHWHLNRYHDDSSAVELVQALMHAE
jgi:hypothetical protein